MAQYGISVTLGAGDKGKQWDSLVRQQAKKKRMSIGAYIRHCIFQTVQRETGQTVDKPAAAQPAAAPAPVAAQAQPTTAA